MNHSEHRDHLLDLLLGEELGGQTPSDLSRQILERAQQPPSLWRRPTGRLIAAAAALTALAAGVWGIIAYTAPPAYPPLVASGSFTLAEGGPLRRGATLVTADEPAQIELGGYVKLDVGRNTRLRIQGAERAEDVWLEEGQIDCEVDRGQGTFVVQTETGTVTVTGTHFRVQVAQVIGSEVMPKTTLVKVFAGAVILSGAWGQRELTANSEARMPPLPAAAVQPAKDTSKDIIVRGKFREEEQGWVFIRNDTKESLLIWAKNKYPKNFKGFRLNADYDVTLRNGKMVAAHSVGGEPK